MGTWSKINEKSSRNPSNIYQKSIKNPPPKIHQQSIKNPQQIDPRGPTGPSWRLLGASWGFLGPLGLSCWPPGAPQARPRGVLGASWWPTWHQLGSQNGAKIDEKSKQKTIKILMPLRIGFLNDFEGFWKQNGGMLAFKIEQTSMLSSRSEFLKKSSFP